MQLVTEEIKDFFLVLDGMIITSDLCPLSSSILPKLRFMKEMINSKKGKP